MAFLHSLKVVEVSHVQPFADSPDSAAVTDFSLPLTFFDTFWLKFPPVERLFFYSLPEAKLSFPNSVLPKLKRSLSVTLRHFLPLAGKVTWPSESPEPIILYTAGDGLSLTIAESDADFDHLSGNHVRKSADFQPLVPRLVVSETGATVMAVSITVFNDGFCIGIVAHHAVLDGKSSTSFMKAWANICRENQTSLPPELTPSFDRTVIKDPTGISALYANQWLAMTGCNSKRDPRALEFLSVGTELPADMVRATFRFSRSVLENLKQRVLNHSGKESEKLRLSSFVLTYCYVFVCILKAKLRDQINDEAYYGFVADYRSRLDPPLPANYFGNCVASHNGCMEGKVFLEEDAFYRVVEGVSELVKETGKDIYEGAEERLSIIWTLAAGAIVVGVAGSPRFGVYSVDFGWGKPDKVEVTSVDKTGAISMAETRDGSGGVEVGVPLKTDEMEIFASLFASGLEAS